MAACFFTSNIKTLGVKAFIHTFASVVHFDFIIDHHPTITLLLVSEHLAQFSQETCCATILIEVAVHGSHSIGFVKF